MKTVGKSKDELWKKVTHKWTRSSEILSASSSQLKHQHKNSKSV